LSEGFILILGSSSGTPYLGESMPSILLAFRGWYILLDAGEGVQLELLSRGIGPSRITSIHVTHMHGDHVFGLPGLLQSMGMSSRTRELVVQGPSSLREYLEMVFRVTGFTPPYTISYKGCQESIEFAELNAAIRIECFRVCHEAESYGYAVTGIKRKRGVLERVFKVSYTGDTRPCDDYLPYITESDVLIHDATFASSMKDEAWRFGHSTAKDAAIVAQRTHSKLLVLFHRSSRFKGKESILLTEARSIHSNTVLGVRGLRVAL